MKIKTISAILGNHYDIIDKRVNDFIKDKKVIDIKTTQHAVMPSGSSRTTYVIMYE